MISLQSLSKRFILILISRLGFENTIRAKEYLQSKDIHFDAVYHHKSNTCYTNYGQIYEDFMIPLSKIATNVLILGPMSIIEEELEANTLQNVDSLKEFATSSALYDIQQAMFTILKA